MKAVEEWLEHWTSEDEDGNLTGEDIFCMTAVCPLGEYELIVEHYGKRQFDASVNHGKNPVTGEWDHRFTTYNVIVRTEDVNLFERLGGSRWVAKAHGYDTHPNMRR